MPLDSPPALDELKFLNMSDEQGPTRRKARHVDNEKSEYEDLDDEDEGLDSDDDEEDEDEE